MLMRLILDASFQKFTTIADEVKFLKLYLELEKLRFGDVFRFDVKIGKDLDYQTEIPSMVIQPFVENAIHHGVSKLERDGEINVYFEKENNHLKITIEDNGIGRSASTKQNKLLNSFKISRGNQLANEKIDVLNRYYNLNITMDILDKIDANNNPQGTKVIIQMNAYEQIQN